MTIPTLVLTGNNWRQHSDRDAYQAQLADDVAAELANPHPTSC